MNNTLPKKLTNEKELPKRIDKALLWLAESRDNWKEKCIKAKTLLKRQKFMNKRVTDSRDEWKLRHIRLKQDLLKERQAVSQLKQRIAELEGTVSDQKKELAAVKKKH